MALPKTWITADEPRGATLGCLSAFKPPNCFGKLLLDSLTPNTPQRKNLTLVLVVEAEEEKEEEEKEWVFT